MTAIHVLAHIKRVRIPATRPAVDDLAASGEATSRDAQRLLGSPEPFDSPAEPITARPAIPLRGGDRSVGSAGVPRGSLPDRGRFKSSSG